MFDVCHSTFNSPRMQPWFEHSAGQAAPPRMIYHNASLIMRHKSILSS